MEFQMIHEMLNNTCPSMTDGKTWVEDGVIKSSNEMYLFYYSLHCMDMWIIAKQLFGVWSIIDYVIVQEGSKTERDDMIAKNGMKLTVTGWTRIDTH